MNGRRLGRRAGAAGRRVGLARVGLSGFGGDASQATVRRVMAHSAGLPLHYQLFYDGEEYAQPPRTETIRRYAFVAHPPGTEFVCSNLGYGVLDHVVERASDRGYADFLRNEVVLPLGMTRTAVGLPETLEPPAAVRYGPDQRPLPFYDFDHPGASAVWSSAHDLVRFGLFHLGHPPEGARRILRPETVEAMQRRETPEGDLDVAVVVLLNNLARDLRVSIGQEVVAALDEGYARSRREALRRAAEAEEPEGEAAFSPPSSLIGRWSGVLRTWEGEVPMALVVAEDGDVPVRVQGQLPAVLDGARFQEDGRLRGRYAGRIPTPDVMRHPLHTVLLDLRLEGARLYGQASAQTEADPTYFSLASYVELARAPE